MGSGDCECSHLISHVAQTRIPVFKISYSGLVVCLGSTPETPGTEIEGENLEPFQESRCFEFAIPSLSGGMKEGA